MPKDKLVTPANVFYATRGMRAFTKDQARKRNSMDGAGRQLYDAALAAEYKRDAKGASYYRRTYCESYVSRSDDGEKIFLNSFDDIGARVVLPASDKHQGWYTDDNYSDTLSGVVVAIGRHTTTEGHNQSDWSENTGLFMAGTQHSDWDGVTLYTDTFDNFKDAARYADRCAEREAESCREEDEKFQREQKAIELRDDIKRARVRCLALLRDMRPIRKGMGQVPETVCDALRNQVQRYLNDIRDFRKELGELA